MHSELSYGLSFAPTLQRVAVIDLSGSHQPTPDPSFSLVVERKLVGARFAGERVADGQGEDAEAETTSLEGVWAIRFDPE